MHGYIGRNYISLRDHGVGKMESTGRAISPRDVIAGVMACLEHYAGTPFGACYFPPILAAILPRRPAFSIIHIGEFSLLPNLGTPSSSRAPLIRDNDVID